MPPSLSTVCSLVVQPADVPHVAAAMPAFWQRSHEAFGDNPSQPFRTGVLIADPEALQCRRECKCAERWQGWTSIFYYTPEPSGADALIRHLSLDPCDIIVRPIPIDQLAARFQSPLRGRLAITILRETAPVLRSLPQTLIAAIVNTVLGQTTYPDAASLASDCQFSRRSLDRALAMGSICTARHLVSILHSVAVMREARRHRLSLKALAARSGSRSVETLNRQFKEVFGVAPRTMECASDAEIAVAVASALRRRSPDAE
jgi:AraC-like DNA-binding protein